MGRIFPVVAGMLLALASLAPLPHSASMCAILGSPRAMSARSWAWARLLPSTKVRVASLTAHTTLCSRRSSQLPQSMTQFIGVSTDLAQRHARCAAEFRRAHCAAVASSAASASEKLSDEAVLALYLAASAQSAVGESDLGARHASLARRLCVCSQLVLCHWFAVLLPPTGDS